MPSAFIIAVVVDVDVDVESPVVKGWTTDDEQGTLAWTPDRRTDPARRDGHGRGGVFFPRARPGSIGSSCLPVVACLLSHRPSASLLQVGDGTSREPASFVFQVFFQNGRTDVRAWHRGQAPSKLAGRQEAGALLHVTDHEAGYRCEAPGQAC
ncbi:uncharacterized protein PSFLO_07369 [Pseudozyma flocculosa]|uniref:Uncharacterized protein n=1 Tax=Pseudozyma flocculosa TaxID=84751 RepID=A0A5C3FE20_9BASI|nr:uncharacterized protein PSFLO_07369 [Pseudozyma flocculosa]